MDKTAEFLQLIADRNPAELFGYGIRTADAYVKGMVDCMGDDVCRSINYPNGITPASPADLLKQAAQTLVYSNDEMKFGEPKTSSSGIEAYCKEIGAAVPPRTIMVFENVVTTPKKDRDGDVLVTSGAKIDMKMPLLWHHMLPMPIGKMLKVLEHTDKRLYVASVLIDTELGNNTAVLIEFGALRISHGFRPTAFERLKESDGDGPYGPGYRITEFEIMEESCVTVPSNTDAVITAFSRGKLTHPLAKAWGKSISDSRNVAVNIAATIRSDGTVEIPRNQKDTITVQTKPDGSSTVWIDADQHQEADAGSKSAGTCGCGTACKTCGGALAGGECATCKAAAENSGKSGVDPGQCGMGNCPTCDDALDSTGTCPKCGYVQGHRSPESGDDKNGEHGSQGNGQQEPQGSEGQGNGQASEPPDDPKSGQGGAAIPDDQGLIKSGRVLSKANETKLEHAAKLIEDVIAQVRDESGDEESGKGANLQIDWSVDQSKAIQSLIGSLALKGEFALLAETKDAIDSILKNHEASLKRDKNSSFFSRLLSKS